MSHKSIAMFEAHQRASATTRPAPPANDPAAELLEQARRHHLPASRALAKALECEAMADLLSGKPRNDLGRRAADLAAELDAIGDE